MISAEAEAYMDRANPCRFSTMRLVIRRTSMRGVTCMKSPDAVHKCLIMSDGIVIYIRDVLKRYYLLASFVSIDSLTLCTFKFIQIYANLSVVVFLSPAQSLIYCLFCFPFFKLISW